MVDRLLGLVRGDQRRVLGVGQQLARGCRCRAPCRPRGAPPGRPAGSSTGGARRPASWCRPSADRPGSRPRSPGRPPRWRRRAPAPAGCRPAHGPAPPAGADHPTTSRPARRRRCPDPSGSCATKRAARARSSASATPVGADRSRPIATLSTMGAANRKLSWNASDIAVRRSSGSTWSIGTPPRRMLPPSGSSRRTSRLVSVLLPGPGRADQGHDLARARPGS